MKKFCVLFLGAIMAITMILPAQQLPDESNSTQKIRYTDGTYIGTGRGFRPGLKVEVDIRDGQIVRVEVLSHNEVGSRFWRRPVKLIPQAIIKKQDTRVDAVGGATYTSRGIMAAVENALSKAGA